MTTTLNGTFTSCGPGQDFGYQFVCNGPSCDELADFPGTTCTSDPTTNALSCNNGVTCSGPSNYTASFNLSQATSLVSLSELITLPDLCEDITVTSLGTTGGVNASYIVTGPCGPGGNTTATNSSSSSSSLLASTSAHSSNSSLSSSSTGLSSFSFFNTSSSVIPTTSVGSAGLGGTTRYPSSSSGSKSSSGGSPPPCHAPSTVSCSESSSAAVSPIVRVTTEVVTAYTTYCPEATTFTQGSSTYIVTAPTTLTITNCPCTLTHTLTGSTPVLAASATTSAASPSSGASGGNGSGSNAPGSEGSNTSAENASSPATPGVSTATSTGSYAGTVTSSASAKPIIVPQSSGANSMRSGFKLSPSKLITIFLSLFFIGSSLASSVSLDSDKNLNHVDDNIALMEDISPAGWISNGEISTTNVDLIKRQSTPGWKTFADLLGEYLGGKLASPGFAENLVAELEEAVCDHIVGGLITDALGVDLVEACVGAIDVAGGLAALGTLQPEIEFLAVLESSILCNALVAEALPGIGQLTDAICKEPKPCSVNLLTDVNNCGQCSNTCPTGQSCVNGACTSGSCTGETCASFGPCGPGGTCVCASTSEGTGYCVDGSTPCAGLATCGTSLDCASGEICAVGSCCDANVCVGATFCGGSNGEDLTARGVLRRTWFNSTISSHGDWYPEFF